MWGASGGAKKKNAGLVCEREINAAHFHGAKNPSIFNETSSLCATSGGASRAHTDLKSERGRRNKATTWPSISHWAFSDALRRTRSGYIQCERRGAHTAERRAAIYTLRASVRTVHGCKRNGATRSMTRRPARTWHRKRCSAPRRQQQQQPASGARHSIL